MTQKINKIKNHVFSKKSMFIDNFSTNSKKKVGEFIEKQYQSPTYLFKKTPISLKSLLCKTSCAVCQKQ